MKWIDLGPYPVDLGFCSGEADWNREMKRLRLTFPYPTSVGTVSRVIDSPLCLIVTLNGLEELHPIQRVGAAVHEAAHVWQQILSYIQEEAVGHETEAYFIQWIVESFIEEMIRLKLLKELK